MDFFSLILEHILEMLNQSFDFIQNPVVRGFIQVLVMFVICVFLVSIFFCIAYIIRKIRGS